MSIVGVIAVSFQLSRDQVRHALGETDRQFDFMLREERADQIDTADELEQEIAELMALLAPGALPWKTAKRGRT